MTAGNATHFLNTSQLPNTVGTQLREYEEIFLTSYMYRYMVPVRVSENDREILKSRTETPIGGISC